MKGLTVKITITALIFLLSFASAFQNKAARQPSFDIHVENPRMNYEAVEDLIDELEPQAYLMADAGAWKLAGDENLFARSVMGMLSAFETKPSGLVGEVAFNRGDSVSLHPLVEKQIVQMDEPGVVLPWVYSARLRDADEPVMMLENVEDPTSQKPNLVLLSGWNQAGERYSLSDLKNHFSGLGDRVQVNSYDELQKKSMRQMSFYGLGLLVLLCASGMFRLRRGQRISAVWRFLLGAILVTQIDYASLPLESINENLVSLSWHLDQIRELREELFLAHRRMMSQEYLHQLTLLRMEGAGMFAGWLGLCWLEWDLRRMENE